MGRLAGFRYRKIVQRLKALGFQFDRQAAGSHEIWSTLPCIDTRPFPILSAMCPRASRFTVIPIDYIDLRACMGL